MKRKTSKYKGFKITWLSPSYPKEYILENLENSGLLNITLPKETPFSQLSKIDKDGKIIRFEDSEKASDKGEFVKTLHSEIDFELIIEELSPKQKEAVRLRYKERLSNKEIALKTNSRLRTVEQRLYRSYKKIRGKIKK